MHFHCEIVIPPVVDVEAAVTSVLKKFDENLSHDDEDYCSGSFWDWWVIGGRWAGAKLMAKYDKEKLAQFRQWLTDEGITVSSLQAGKQELSPASQIQKVDAKWNEMFPSDLPMACPMFNHANDQYGRTTSSALPDDVCRLADVPERLEISRVIFAKPSYDSDTKDWTGPLEAGFMLCDTQWNGCNHMKVDWDTTFASALSQYVAKTEGYRDEFRARIIPQPDWLVVTVDYHS